MFGYVEPDKPELKIREFDVFRGYYCSLCRTIGRLYGQVPRISLNYDLTFLYVLLDSIDSGKITGTIERCLVHPAKKRFIITSNSFAEYCADMNIILTYYNLKDKWQDKKSLAAYGGLAALSGAFKKARKKHPEKCEALEKCLNRLSDLEKNGCDTVDEAAEPFAELMRELFECGYIKDEGDKKALGWMGYNLGRWIYILDAYDDLEEDIKDKNYNPILMQYDYNNGEDIDQFKASVRDAVNFNLTFSISEVEKSYTLLNIEKNKGLIDNIIYSGLLAKTDKVLQGRGKENEKESI
mgnify:CR=1 FL=1